MLKTGFVLSAGGIRGVYAHTGFLQAMEALGIRPMALAGCSAGAIVGGVYASGGNLQQWSQAIAAVSPKQFWRPDSFASIAWNIVVRKGRGWTGLSRTDAAVQFFSQYLAADTFEACRFPFHTVVYSLGHGHRVLLSSGSLAPAMMASAAVPVVYRPVKVGDDLYCDGGLVELSPVDAICCRHGLDLLIVHHVSRRFPIQTSNDWLRDKRWAMAEILERILGQQRTWYLGDEPLSFRRCRCGCKAVIAVLEPELPDLRWPLTTGGPQVQQTTYNQITDLLRPQLGQLLEAPQRLVTPVSAQ